MLPHLAFCSARALSGALLASALVLQGCGGDSSGAGGAGSGGAGAGAGTSSGTTKPGSCDTDPLKTGIVAQQTGVSADAFDCEILDRSAKFKEPDPMIFKAVMYNESRFDDKAIACPNLPCGTPNGWSVAESGCYGLMQVVPACGGDTNKPCLLANGHPNLTTDESAPGWAGSVFNPSINTEIGIGGFADNRAQVVAQFPGCTEEQYTLMALGNYANYGSTMSCSVYNTDYTSLVLGTYHMYATAAGYPEHPYP